MHERGVSLIRISSDYECFSVPVVFVYIDLKRAYPGKVTTHLKSLPVHSDIPISKLIYKLHQSGHHSVQAIS